MSEVAVNKVLQTEKIRKQFPVLDQLINGNPLVYFDNAATTQKPDVVINALREYYEKYNANIHRGIHSLAEAATGAFEDSRKVAADFIGAAEPEEVIFTKGTTESINLVASTYGRKYVKSGDEILISGLEHHSNIVPWQMLAEEKGATIKVIPVLENGTLDMNAFRKLLSGKTRMVTVNHASNSLGTINPIQEIISLSHQAGAIILIDGAQAGAHLPIDVVGMDCDFYATSAHKFYGPTGTGLLYGKRSLLEDMPPYQGGGEMIRDVSFAKTTYNDIPYKFEAGTPNIAGVVAMKYAMEYITGIGKEVIASHENDLLTYATEQIQTVEGVRVIGTAPQKVSVLSFVIDGIHPFDVGQMLDARGVAVRTGHHCTQPLMDHFCIEGTIRASFAMYNTREEIDIMIEGLRKVVNLLK
jgi:cysteine desulfurase/selenocysteine lyase